MTKQNPNPNAFTSTGNATVDCVAIDITNEDRIDVLSESNKHTIAIAKVKTDHLLQIMNMESAYLTNAKNIDAVSKSTDLKQRLNCTMTLFDIINHLIIKG
jgi:hypothetical protein